MQCARSSRSLSLSLTLTRARSHADIVWIAGSPELGRLRWGMPSSHVGTMRVSRSRASTLEFAAPGCTQPVSPCGLHRSLGVARRPSAWDAEVRRALKGRSRVFASPLRAAPVPVHYRGRARAAGGLLDETGEGSGLMPRDCSPSSASEVAAECGGCGGSGLGQTPECASGAASGSPGGAWVSPANFEGR